AVYLEGGLEEAKQLFGRLLFNKPEGGVAQLPTSSATETMQEFPLEETLQTGVSKAAKKMIKTQKSASKKLKPALTQKRRICSFSGV
ncbi:zinc finger protein 64 isoform X3, partial [Tachysurus ichikawai]